MLVYDGDCGFCVRSLGWGHRLGVTGAEVPWQAADLDALGLTETEVREAVWYVEPERSWRGHEAIARALMTSRYAVVRLAGRVLAARPVAPLGRAAYAWVARNRHRLLRARS